MQLKAFQRDALQSLRRYVRECSASGDPKSAYESLVTETLGRSVPFREAEGMPGVPYVCIRIPTGGGKTFVAAHCVSVIAKELSRTDHPLVVWLCPTNTILNQTINNLRDRAHPYNQALTSTLGPNKVLDLEGALILPPSTLDAQSVVVVATLQSFRVKDKEGRKVYEANGSLLGHFSRDLSKVTVALEREVDGSLVPSLENVIRMYHPIVIVDEAHNATTALSFETLSRLSPTAIVEYTATPDYETSNVLYAASAAQLKAEDMLKVPVYLEATGDETQLLQDAIGALSNLRNAAIRERTSTGEYLRPIILFQAERHSRGGGTTDVETVIKRLVEGQGIDRSKIAVSTGEVDELEGVDILDQSCPIEYIVTQAKLREGWDCPFAYVLCSFAEVRSPTAVEQLLGRIIRMPGARRKETQALNVAYAYVRSQDFKETAEALRDALVNAGFEKLDAIQLLRPLVESPGFSPSPPGILPLEAFLPPDPIPVPAGLRIETSTLSPNVQAKLLLDAVSKTLSINRPLTIAERDELMIALPDLAEPLSRLPVLRPVQLVGPSLFSHSIRVPKLSARAQSSIEDFNETQFMDAGWDILRCDPNLSEAEFPSAAPLSERGEVDIGKDGKVIYRHTAAIQMDLTILAREEGWNEGFLVRWIDSAVPHEDVTPANFAAFVAKSVAYLERVRGLDLNYLVHQRFRLRDAVDAHVDRFRTAHRREAFQTLLTGRGPVEVFVDPSRVFEFPREESYGYHFRCEAPYVWKHHLYSVVGDLEPRGEEFECAVELDSIPGIDVWVRNVVQARGSFWLQTSSDRFYPDFVARLSNGKVLVAEYKGEHFLGTEDTEEKRMIGEYWEAKSHGECFFVMISRRDWGSLRAKVKAALGA